MFVKAVFDPSLRLFSIFVLLATILSSSFVWAEGGPPMLTDDPGTPGNHQYEVNTAILWDRTPQQKLYELPLVDANYGLGNRIQLKWELPLELQTIHEHSESIGLGYSLVGVKWRFLDSAKSKGLTVSTYPQIGFRNATGLKVEGENGQSLFLPIEIEKQFKHWDIGTEVGYQIATSEPNEAHIGLVVGRQFHKIQILTEWYNITGQSLRQETGIINIGVRYPVSQSKTILISIGHTLLTADEPSHNIFYIGLQLTNNKE